MDRIAAMEAFARVARLGSFTGAAQELRISTTAISRRVSDLEGQLGVPLLERNTRRLSLTEVGAGYLERCERLLDDLAELESAAAKRQASVRGTLRVTAGVDFGRDPVAGLIAEFQRANPETRIDLYLADYFVDLVGEGFDVAVRMGDLADSSLIARRLGASRLVPVASPDYLETHGGPEHPRELASHTCVLDSNGGPRWTFRRAEGSVSFAPNPRFAVNSPSITRDLVLAGRGISVIPHFAIS